MLTIRASAFADFARGGSASLLLVVLGTTSCTSPEDPNAASDGTGATSQPMPTSSGETGEGDEAGERDEGSTSGPTTTSNESTTATPGSDTSSTSEGGDESTSSEVVEPVCPEPGESGTFLDPTCEPLDFIAGEAVVFWADNEPEGAATPGALLVLIRPQSTCDTITDSLACGEWNAWIVIPPEAQAPGTYTVGYDQPVQAFYNRSNGELGDESCFGGVHHSFAGTIDILEIDSHSIHIRTCGLTNEGIDLDGDIAASICSC